MENKTNSRSFISVNLTLNSTEWYHDRTCKVRRARVGNGFHWRCSSPCINSGQNIEDSRILALLSTSSHKHHRKLHHCEQTPSLKRDDGITLKIKKLLIENQQPNEIYLKAPRRSKLTPYLVYFQPWWQGESRLRIDFLQSCSSTLVHDLDFEVGQKHDGIKWISWDC